MFFKKNFEAERLYNKSLNYESNEELCKKYLEEAARLGYAPAQIKLGYFDNLLLSTVEFSVRSQNAFRSSNIVYLNDLIEFSERDFLRIPNLGRKSLNEIKSFLEFKGLKFGYELPEIYSETYHSKQDNSNIPYLNLPEMIEVQDQELSSILWSIRTSNCLKRNGIDLLSQLLRYSKFDLLRLPNFGRKSLNEIEEFLKLHDLYFGIYDDENLRVKFLEPKLDEEKEEIIQYEKLNIIEEFKNRLETLNDRQRDVIKKRLGIDCEEHTLEEIGGIYNVTRERVRQIEKRAKILLEHPSKNWHQKFWQNTLNDLIKDSDRPLSINNLDKNHQFSGIKNNQTLFKYLLSKLESNFFIHDNLGYSFISKADETDFSNLSEKTKEVLKISVGKTINLIEESCNNIFSNFPELKKHVIRFLLQHSTTSYDENEHEFLTAYSEKKTALTIVRSIFYKSEKILTNKEIQYIVNSEFPEYGFMNIRNRIPDLKDVYPMTHGSWGKIENLNINEITLNKIIEEIPALIKDLNKEEFNAIEIYEKIKNKFKFIKNEFEISAIIREFKLAKYLGRNSFAVLGSKLTKRTELNEIIISILEKFGRPLNQNELVNEIKKIKGFSNLMQFQIRKPVKLLRTRHYALEYWEESKINYLDKNQNLFNL